MFTIFGSLFLNVLNMIHVFFGKKTHFAILAVKIIFHLQITIFTAKFNLNFILLNFVLFIIHVILIVIQKWTFNFISRKQSHPFLYFYANQRNRICIIILLTYNGYIKQKINILKIFYLESLNRMKNKKILYCGNSYKI